MIHTQDIERLKIGRLRFSRFDPCAINELRKLFVCINNINRIFLKHFTTLTRNITLSFILNLKQINSKMQIFYSYYMMNPCRCRNNTINKQMNLVAQTLIDEVIPRDWSKEMGSLSLHEVQVSLRKVHVEQPVTISFRAWHWHDIASTTSPRKMIRSKHRLPPSKINL